MKKRGITLNKIEKYIAIPMAVTVFKQDKEQFVKYQLGNLYLDMIESIIERMHQEYLEIKALMYSKYHVDIKKIDSTTYKFNDDLVEFKPEELKEMTRQVMSDYLNGDKAAVFERKERIWKN